MLMAVLGAGDAPGGSGAEGEAAAALGARLFEETRFASPLGDMAVSCATCHPRVDANGGYRAFTEPRALSWHPWRYEDPGRQTLRNAPTLFEVAEHRFVHADGAFRSLEDQSAATLTGRNFGWLPEEADAAARAVASLARMDEAAGGYREGFARAYGVDVTALDDARVVHAVARAISDFVRSLAPPRSSPYDAFVRANGLDGGPARGEGPRGYGDRLLAALDALEAEGGPAFVAGFDAEALEGYRIFLRTSGGDRAGNCVACHVPPSFTDGAFHNTGVTQAEYDRVHGAGSFMDLAIPARGRRPRERFLSRATPDRPGHTDLGYWNFARFEDSAHYRAQEAEADFVQRQIATFKTPTLRNLASTGPYMHNGFYPGLVSVLDQKIQSGFLARMGQLRNPDPELERIRFIIDDIPALFAFLNALNDAGTNTAAFPGLPTGSTAVSIDSSYTYSE